MKTCRTNSWHTFHFLHHPSHTTLGNEHRVGRVLSFFSSRRNWDSPNPSPAGECATPFGSWGRGTLAGERGVGRVPFRRGDIHYGDTLYINVLCGNELRLKLLLGVCNTKKRCYISISLYGAGAGDDEVELESTTRHQEIFPSI